MDPLTLNMCPAGLLLPVKVLPGSKSNSFRGIHDGRLKVSVTAAPEKGKANKAVLQFLARKFHLAKNQLEVQSGLTDPNKTILIQGITEPELRELLESLL